MPCDLLIKAGVDISRLDRPTRRGLQAIGSIFAKYKEPLIITSTYEGNHSPGSLHYANRAIDIRIPPNNTQEIWIGTRNALGNDWDKIQERAHWHFEYDPK